MPTGYTQDIFWDKGITFAEFALRCSCMHGPEHLHRDEDPNSEAELTDNGKFFVKQKQEAQLEVARLLAMSSEERLALGSMDLAADVSDWQKYIDDKNSARARFDKMLVEVEAWQPPTPDHYELKNFMKAQIHSSVNEDCDASYEITQLENIKRKTPMSYFNERLKYAKFCVNDYENRIQQEILKVKGSNKWRRELFDSLGIEYK